MEENKVKISDLINNRIDPHYYKKEYLDLTDSLKFFPTDYLGNIVEFSDETWNQTSKYKDEFPYIEISEIDIINGKIRNINWCRTIEAPSRAKMLVRDGDIIISTTRPHRGAIALITSKYNEYIASTGFSIIRNLRKNNLSKEYLYTFLRTNLSLKQMQQRSSGGNYPAITQEELKKILIPIPSLNIQEKIIQLMSDAASEKQEREEEAQKFINKIDDVVLTALNINIPEIENKKAYKSTFSNISGGRIDVKYHQPKYEELEKNIRNSGNLLCTLDNICDDIISGQRPKGGVSQITEGIPSIGGEHILRNGTVAIENLKYIPEDFHKKQIKSKIKPFDIILVKDGATTGKVGIIPKDYPYKEANINEHVFILRCKNNINPYYLLSFLLSKIGQIQIEREVSGATIMGITKDSLKNIIIPIPDILIQDAIANEYINRLTQSKQLIEKANKEFEEVKNKIEKIIIGEESL